MRIRKSLLVLAVFAIAFSLTISPVLASSPYTTNYKFIRSVKLPVVAVASNGKGVVSELVVSVAYPGSGEVFFSAEPLTMLDSQASARIAVLVATALLGIDYRMYDFFIMINSSSLIIGGPSAGAAMTIGVLAALTNTSIRDDVAITGMINPDGTIGPVGGIPEKLEAAARAGYKIFLIPAGQSITYEEKVVRETTPMGVVTRITSVPVNVTELGAKLGVKVIEVGDIVEAASIMLAKKIQALKEVVKPSIGYSSEQEKMFRYWVNYIGNKTLETLERLKPPASSIAGLVNQSYALLEKSSEALENGEYYVAATYAFRAAIYAETAYVKARLNNENVIMSYVRSVNATISRVESELEKMNVNTLSELEAYVACKRRVDEAASALKDAVNSIEVYTNLLTGEKKVVVGKPEELAYAKWRAVSAELWLNYSKVRAPSINKESLYRVARELLYYTETVLSYYNTLTNQQPKTLYEEYFNARTYYIDGDYPSCIAMCIDVLSTVNTRLHAVFSTNVSKLIEILNKTTIANLCRVSNYTSAIALGYYRLAVNDANEYFKTRNAEYAYSSLRLFVESSTLAFMLHELTIKPKTTLQETIKQTTFTTTHTETTSTQVKQASTNTTKSTSKGAAHNTGKGIIALSSVIIAILLLYAIVYSIRRRA